MNSVKNLALTRLCTNGGLDHRNFNIHLQRGRGNDNSREFIRISKSICQADQSSHTVAEKEDFLPLLLILHQENEFPQIVDKLIEPVDMSSLSSRTPVSTVIKGIKGHPSGGKVVNRIEITSAVLSQAMGNNKNRLHFSRSPAPVKNGQSIIA